MIAPMSPLRWISSFILAACLISQLMSFRIEERLPSQPRDFNLTRAQTTGVITECLLLEAPLSNRMAKATALLVSSRRLHGHQAISIATAHTSTPHSHPGNPRAQFFYHNADNRGPPLA